MSSPQPRRSVIAETDGGADRALIRLYWPEPLRPAFDALFAIDDVMASIVASTTQPAIGAIRLAWWREALERLDTAEAPAEPRLRAAKAVLVEQGISGAALGRLDKGWAAMLDEMPDVDGIAEGGAILFTLGAQILGTSDPKIDVAGKLYASVRAGHVEFAAMQASALSGHRFAKALRPLTGLARLAARDLARAPVREPQGTPGRAAALLRHRWSGLVL